MSKEYIEREAIIQEIKEAKNDFSPTVRPIFDVATHLVSHAPTADVAPVVHGKWVYDRWCEFKCSICGHWSNTLPKAQEKYCPNCGARMNGGK